MLNCVCCEVLLSLVTHDDVVELKDGHGHSVVARPHLKVNQSEFNMTEML